MKISVLSPAIALLAVIAAGLPCAVSAASGLAYDSVTKFSMGDSATAAPGTFSADFQTASSAPAAGNAPHIPFGFGKMVAKAQAAVAAMQNGSAERHFVGTNKERVDNVALKTSEITDCTARTVTHLDLDKKTYSITSLDAAQTTSPSSSSGRHSQPESKATDDGTKVAIAVTTKAVGSMTIDGVPTTGYDMDIKMTATKPSGETSTNTMNLLAYYSALAEPHFGCGYRSTATSGATGPGAAGMANFALVMKALANKGDSRFTVTNSGPQIPTGKLAMWQAMKMSAATTTDSSRGGFGIVTERGNVKTPLADTDPVFGIPAGFTKVDA